MTTTDIATAKPAASTGADILAGYVEQGEFARIHKISPRTAARYRGLPDGLPWVEFGGRVYIPNAEAAAWLKNRVRHPNPKRRS